MMKTSEHCLRLEAGALRRFDGDPRFALSCLEGVAWVTQEGDLQDHILRAGETLALGGKGLVLVEALQPSTVEVLLPGEPLKICCGEPAFAAR